MSQMVKMEVYVSGPHSDADRFRNEVLSVYPDLDRPVVGGANLRFYEIRVPDHLAEFVSHLIKDAGPDRGVRVDTVWPSS